MKKFIALLGLIVFVSGGCKSFSGDNIVGFFKYKKPDKYNFKLIVFRNNLQDPSQDKRCYYKVYIDKEYIGRTTIALDSQKKFFTKKISDVRHLLVIEKWELDPVAKKYVKLNNVQQPKPSFHYFTTHKKRIVVITMQIGKDRKTSYAKDFEKR